MKILLFGATGMVGSRIAAEALRRGHEVTAVSRSGKTPSAGGAPVSGEEGALTAVAADASDAGTVTRLAGGHDAVASALAPPRDGSAPAEPFLADNRALIDGVRNAGVRRLVVVGGAGSLEVAPGTALVDTPGFPDAYKGEALAHRDVLALYRSVEDLDWTYISPAPEIGPGERTGAYRLGGDQLLEGGERVSAEDYAVAFLDVLERDTHPRTRVSAVN